MDHFPGLNVPNFVVEIPRGMSFNVNDASPLEFGDAAFSRKNGNASEVSDVSYGHFPDSWSIFQHSTSTS